MSERPNFGDPLDANRDQGFIPQIFNYCDRWCERCAFTLRCRVYSMEADLAEDIEDADEAVDETLLNDASALDEEDDGAWPEELEDSEFREPIHDLKGDAESDLDVPMGVREAEGNLREEAAHERGGRFVQSAEAYAWRVKALLDDHPELADEDIADLIQILSSRETHPADIKGSVVRLVDALETIIWYPFVITTKLRRAYLSQVDELVGDGAEEYRDSDGSAKVALIAIDRSLEGWAILEMLLPMHAQVARDCQERLNRLRNHIEEQFAAARSFRRPGFDP